MQALWFERSVTFSKVFNQIFRSNEVYVGVSLVFHFVIPSISFCIVTTHLLSCLKFGLYEPSLLYCAEQIGIPIVVKPFSTILLNRGCLYQPAVKAQLVWLFCFTKLSILISSSLKIYCDGNSDICNVFFLLSEHVVLGSKVKVM